MVVVSSIVYESAVIHESVFTKGQTLSDLKVNSQNLEAVSQQEQKNQHRSHLFFDVGRHFVLKFQKDFPEY